MATLNFKGKTFVQNYHLAVKYHQLIPKKNKSLTDKVSLNDNLILHGDNLKALKALLPTYAGKVKCIYIDPPYNTGNDGEGPYKLDPLYSRNFYTPYEYTFKNGVLWKTPEGNYPRYSPETLKKMEEKNEIDFNGKEPRAKRYLSRVQEGVPPDTLLSNKLVGFNKDETSELAKIFDGKKVFNQPKPTSLIKFLLQIERKIDRDNKDSIVLDSFAGSGTTTHAVLDLNKEDGGNRKFILVECEDYADKITAERVRRIIKDVPNAKDEKYPPPPL